MRKGLWVTFLVLLCGAILVISYLSYQEKLDLTVKPEDEMAGGDTGEDAGGEEQAGVALSAEKFEGLTAGMDEKVRDVLQKRLDAGEDAQMVVVGSADIQGVADRLADAVHDAYGEFLSVDAFAFDGTSEEFIAEGMPHLAWTNGYDVVVYEPFTLNNNGVVVIEEEQAHLAQVEERAMEAVPDSAFVVTPPQPVQEPSYYGTQIESLKEYATGQGIPYVDHWGSWPEDLGEALDKDGHPSDVGLDAWAGALIEYFIAK